MHFFYTGRLIYDDCRLQLSALRQTELCLDWSICSSESGAQTVRLQVIAALETKINTLVKFSGPPDTLPRLQPASTLIRIQLDRRFIKKKKGHNFSKTHWNSTVHVPWTSFYLLGSSGCRFSGKKHSEQVNRLDKLRPTGPTDSQDSVWHICGLKEINYIQNSTLFRGSFQGFDSSRSKVWVLMKNWKKLKWFPGLRRRALPHSSLGGTASQDSVSHLTTCCRWIHPPVAAAAAAAETPTR